MGCMLLRSVSYFPLEFRLPLRVWYFLFSVRLEGTLSQYRKLDLSNEEKDEKIKDLEARFVVSTWFTLLLLL